LTFVGLIGLEDPARADVPHAIKDCRAAGIRVVMVTGDHAVTARSIGRAVGLGHTAAHVVEGKQVERVVKGKSDELGQIGIFARVSPAEKLALVRAYQDAGAIVAMTGDGVNDAPALREAHIGIAMGRTGTEVNREASDIVLADDNFATIVAAVEEGRGIFENIRKTIVYLLAGNTGELAVVFVAAVLGLPPPLLPLHLLWINLVTDGIPALALVTDRSRDSTMKRPPRPASEPMLGFKEWRGVVLAGALQAVTTLSIFIWALEARGLVEARNLAFSVLVFGELLRAFSARDPDRPFWEIGLFSNLRLFSIVLVSMLVQLGIHHIPATQRLFNIGALSLFDCMLSVVVGATPLLLLEIAKVWRRALHRHSGTPFATEVVARR
jgi:Ca2+-transporting ATPase